MKYDAFISYSHSDCGTIAPAIQKAIENIGKPWYQLKRSLNVFRDETNLGANPHLWENIEKALDDSKNFILLASPKACESDWVTKEIEKWAEKDPLLQKFNIVVTSGEIYWDKSNNDFDWKKTTCLPICLKDKFQSEPLYIDLKDYVNKNNRPIDYKSSGFTYKIVKIIAAITGMEPREIESDEKKRRNNTIFALMTTVITFVSIAILGYMFYQQKEINEKNAISNNLIAEGNKYRETDRNRALLLYGYAYDVNNSKTTFKILNDFYNSNILIDTLEYYQSDTVKQIVYKSNTFFELIKKKERNYKQITSLECSYTNTTNNINIYNGYYFKKISLLMNNNTYFKVDPNYLHFFSLNSNKQLYKIKIDTKNLINYYTKPKSNSIIFQYEDYLLNYDIIKKKFSKVINYHFYKEPYRENYGISLSETGKYLTLYNIKMDGTLEIKVYNLLKGENNTYNFSFYKNKDMSIPSIENISQISNNGEYFFFQVWDGTPFTSISYIYNLKSTKYCKLFEDSMENHRGIPTCLKFLSLDNLYSSKNDVLIYATMFDGVVLENFFDFPESFSSGLHSMTISEKFTSLTIEYSFPYLFVGNSNGSITIFFMGNINEKWNSWESSLDIKDNIQLKNKVSINSICYDKYNKLIYIVNDEGEIYKLDLKKNIPLKSNPETIINKLVKDIGVEDLSNKERLDLNIIQKK